MNLKNKKQLAIRTLKIGKERIIFLESRKDEIKEAITKQDIRDLITNGAIIIKEIKGRRKIQKRKRQRNSGSIKKKVNKRKQEYVKITRKLRAYGKEMLNQEKISKEELKDIRKKIKNRYFKSQANLKNYIGVLKK
jgi:large subunit ribosomal protein L19e